MEKKRSIITFVACAHFFLLGLVTVDMRTVSCSASIQPVYSKKINRMVPAETVKSEVQKQEKTKLDLARVEFTAKDNAALAMLVNKHYGLFIREASQLYQIPHDWILSVILKESSGRWWAVSDRGAEGLMGLMPDTAAELDVADSFDPRQNILGGTKYLRHLLDRYRDFDKALSAYNNGPGRLKNRIEQENFNPRRDCTYVKMVKKIKRQIS